MKTFLFVLLAAVAAVAYAQSRPAAQGQNFVILNTGNNYSSVWLLDANSGALSYCWIVAPSEPANAAPTHVDCAKQRSANQVNWKDLKPR